MGDLEVNGDSRPVNVLVVQTGFLGDAVLGTSLIAALRLCDKVGGIGYAVRQSYAALFRDCSDVDVVFDVRKRDREAQNDVRSRIASHSFDLALIPHRSFSSARLVRGSGIPRRIGFRSAEGGLLYTDRVDYRIGVPEVVRNLDLLTAWTGAGDARPPLTSLSPPAAGPESSSRPVTIAVAYGSVWATKQWGEDRYVMLCRKFREEGIRPILVGSPAERAQGERIAAAAGIPPQDLLAGELSLTELASVLRGVRVTISNDSGAMHLSEAVGTPVVVISGPTIPEFGFAPLLPQSRLVDAGERECRPCGIHGGDRCPLDHHLCMREIAVEAVYRQAVEVCRNLSEEEL